MSQTRVRLNNLSTQKVTGRSLRLSRLSRKRFPFPSAASIIANYIEDVFSTYLYTGNGSTQTITNNIDLSGKGGLTWIKCRPTGRAHGLYDTLRGALKKLVSNDTNAEETQADSVTAFNANGFSVGSYVNVNTSGESFVSWTFRKQAKFFDVVTYTGDGVTSRAVGHSLGSTPGFVIIKATSTTSNWAVYHRGNGSQFLTQGQLNATNALSDMTGLGWLAPTSTNFYPGYIRDSSGNTSNANGVTYVAYLFAHDAGGFGLTGTDNVISCGSFTTDGSGNATVSLGYEPQWLLQKSASGSFGTGNWFIADNMRGLPVGSAATLLRPNLADAESTGGTQSLTATGFSVSGFQATTTYIYIAIRRGPMQTPTSGTSVFDVQTTSSVSSIATTSFSVVIDAYLQANRNATAAKALFPRLTQLGLLTYSTASESAAGTLTANFGISPQTSVERPVVGGTSTTGVLYGFVRAPGFFDVVTYTATGSNGLIVNHNLGVVPELTILKSRTGTRNWEINFDFTSTQCKRLQFTTTNAVTGDYGTSGISHYAKPTTTQLSLTGSTNAPNTNTNTENIIGYLFASCPGVSKFGSYTGTGTTLQIDCGFTAGARFVMIKCTDSDNSPQNWYVWDSARGIVGGDDPYLFLNSTAAEVTNTDYIDTYNPGFEISSTAPIQINALNGTYIFLAIA